MDIELVKEVLRAAVTGKDAKHTQRGLARDAGLDEDAVRDILRGTNKNPTVKTLSALAEAMGKDLSVFGITPQSFVINEEQLRDELERAIPHMPVLADAGERAQYLAEAVADALGLPRIEPEGDPKPPRPSGKRAKGGAPSSPKA